MAKVENVVGIYNMGAIESGRFSPVEWYTIDRIVLKTRDGRRVTRYAVCVNGCWKSSEQMTLREARERVAWIRNDIAERAYYAMYI